MHGVDRLSQSFDSVPQNLIIQSLEFIGINNKIMSFTKEATSYWKNSAVTMNQSISTMRRKNIRYSIRICCVRYPVPNFIEILYVVSLGFFNTKSRLCGTESCG